MNQTFAQSKLLTALLAFFLLLLSIAYAYQINVGKSNFLYTDYGKFYQSERFALEGKNIYSKLFLVRKNIPQNLTLPRIKLATPLLNPPFFALLIAPLGYLSYASSLWLWSGLSILAGILSILLLQKALDIKEPTLNLTLSLLLALFVYFPTFATLQFGQATLLLLPFALGGWLAARTKAFYTAGFVLGIAASLKPFFVLFLLYFLLRREWRAFFCMCLAIVICALLAFIPFGMQTYINYYHVLQQIYWYASSWNASLLGFLLRLFGGEANTPLLAIPGLANKLFAWTSIILILSLVKFIWPRTILSQQQKCDLDFAITLVVMLLISPLAWLYYFPLLLIPIVVLLRFAEQLRSESLRLLTCASVVLSGIPHLLATSERITAHNVYSIFILSSCYVAALLILFGALFFTRARLLHNTSPTNNLPVNSSEQILTYAIALLPSLFGLLNIVNSGALFGVVFVPQFSGVIVGN